MKLKYYLRGVGVGIIVAVVIMSALNKNAIADARVDAIKDYQQNMEKVMETETSTNEEASETTIQQSSIISERDEELEQEIENVIEGALESEADVEYVEEQTSTVEAEIVQDDEEQYPQVSILGQNVIEIGGTDEVIPIEVLPGDTATSVAERLCEKGIISDSEQFVLFMKQQGYHVKLRTGIKNIRATDTWEVLGRRLVTKEQLEDLPQDVE